MSFPVGTVLKIAQNILLPDGTGAVNVYWAQLGDNAGAGPLDDADILSAAGNWMDLLYANIVPDLTNQIGGGLVEVWAVDLLTSVLTPIGDGNATWLGTNVLDPFPNGVAAIASLKTVNTQVTGRKFLPGYVEEAFEDNNMDILPLGRLVLYAALWQTIYIDLNDVILDPGVYSRAKLAFFLKVGAVTANAIAGYQRRRKPGVGS